MIDNPYKPHNPHNGHNYNGHNYNDYNYNGHNYTYQWFNKIIYNNKFNIAWLIYVAIHYFVEKYFYHILNNFLEMDECSGEYDCDVILDLLINKNNYSFDFMYAFCFMQLLILVINLIYNYADFNYFSSFDRFSANKIKNSITNICGIVYLTTSVWKCSIILTYIYDEDFCQIYKFYINDNYLFDIIKFATYYYLFGEMISFIIIMSILILIIVVLLLH